MTLAFIYAYLSNLSIYATVFMWILLLLLILLCVARFTNEINRDDWIYLMYYLVPSFFICLLFTCIPSFDNMKEVKLTLDKMSKEIQGDIPNEVNDGPVVLNPASCDAIGMCSR